MSTDDEIFTYHALDGLRSLLLNHPGNFVLVTDPNVRNDTLAKFEPSLDQQYPNSEASSRLGVYRRFCWTADRVCWQFLVIYPGNDSEANEEEEDLTRFLYQGDRYVEMSQNHWSKNSDLHPFFCQELCLTSCKRTYDHCPSKKIPHVFCRHCVYPDLTDWLVESFDPRYLFFEFDQGDTWLETCVRGYFEINLPPHSTVQEWLDN